MRGVRSPVALASGALASVGVHAFAMAGLSVLPGPEALKTPEVVEVSIGVAEVAPKTVEQVVEPEPDSAPAPKPAHAPATPARPSAVEQPAREAPDEPRVEKTPEGPVDLTGTTLTAEGGGWAADPGNGLASRGPIRAARPAASPRPRATSPPKPVVRQSPPMVPAASLASPPRAPNLNARLARHYPAAAKAQGVGGEAVVRVRISADGRVVAASVMSESFPGFGAACQATVMGSSWSPPLDAKGRRVGTEVRYRCRFRVDT